MSEDADAAPPGLGFLIDGGFYKDSAPTELWLVALSKEGLVALREAEC